MKDALVIVIGLVLLSLQAVVHLWIPSGYFIPDLVIPFVLYLGFIDFGSARGASLAFVIGYMTDACSGSPAGVYLFVIPATYLLFRFIHRKLLFTGLPFRMAMTFAASITASLTVVGMRSLFERTIMSPTAVALTVLLHALATALFSPLVFWLGTRILPESPKHKEEKVVV